MTLRGPRRCPEQRMPLPAGQQGGAGDDEGRGGEVRGRRRAEVVVVVGEEEGQARRGVPDRDRVGEGTTREGGDGQGVGAFEVPVE